MDKVRHAFTSEKPKLRYPVTLVTRAVAVLKRLLPGRAMDKILSRGELKRAHAAPMSKTEYRLTESDCPCP